tara:strand:+ start:77 stop:451 length:375 start_codon:yes stop_codon:yes gene_type:complete
MKSFFLKAARYAKRIGAKRKRIQTLQQMSDKTEWCIKDFTQFKKLISRSDFTAEYDTSIYNIHDSAKEMMMYPQVYYIQLLDDGTWLYEGIFDDIVFESKKLSVVEEYVYKQITSLPRKTTKLN